MSVDLLVEPLLGIVGPDLFGERGECRQLRSCRFQVLGDRGEFGGERVDEGDHIEPQPIRRRVDRTLDWVATLPRQEWRWTASTAYWLAMNVAITQAVAATHPASVRYTVATARLIRRALLAPAEVMRCPRDPAK